MTPSTIGIVGIAVLFIFLFSGMPIAFAMGLTGFLGFLYLRGLTPALGELIAVPYTTFASYDLSVIPLFVIMGEFCYHAGISTDLYNTVYKWLGNLPGGLAMATIGGCAGFAAVCGSSIATAVTMGMVALPQMKKYGYDSTLATGCVAAGGTIGILIPPSIMFVIYGIITEQSIGKLFLAGFVPGFLQAFLFVVTIFLLCKRNPLFGPPGAGASLKEKLFALKDTWAVVILFLVVIGGLYLGMFTPTEAAGIGACFACFFTLGKRRLTWQALKGSVLGTIRTSCMLFMIILGATILSHFLALTQISVTLSNIVAGLQINRYIIICLIIFMYVVLGCFLDAGAMVLVTMPTVYPMILALHFDPIWFGVLIVIMVEIGLITPPVGLNVFAIHGIAKDVPMYSVFRGIAIFLVPSILLVVLIIAVPQIALFLPSLMWQHCTDADLQ